MLQLTGIYDTREKILVPDGRGEERVSHIPRTGHMRACDSCGAIHEVHAYLQEKDSGKTLIVGLGCARKMDGVGGQIDRWKLEVRLAEAETQLLPWAIRIELVERFRVAYGRTDNNSHWTVQVSDGQTTRTRWPAARSLRDTSIAEKVAEKLLPDSHIPVWREIRRLRKRIKALEIHALPVRSDRS
jgi:hypothetical protein